MPSNTMPFPPLDFNDLNNFDKFPPNVKRKYFSSLERLRLAQAASRPQTGSGSNSHHRIITAATSPISLRHSLSRQNSNYFRSPSILRSRSKTHSPTIDTSSPSDAQWFLRLPETVQRKHFTPEERWLLSGLPESVLPDAADERVYRNIYHLSREANRSVPTLRHSSFSSASSISTFDATVESDVDSAIAMEDSDFDGFRWIENDDDHDLASTLDPYHSFVNNTAVHKQKRGKRSPSFRRALSMTGLPFASSNTVSKYSDPSASGAPPSVPAPQLPSMESIHQRAHQTRRQSSSRPGHLLPIHHNKTPSNPIDPSAIHYTDPSARLKLKVYLGSPQKFDEAIEFGFPSMEDKENMPLSRPSLTRSHRTAPSIIPKTFLDDSNPSIFDALDDPDDDDTVSLPERDQPYTPLDTQFTDAHFADTYLLSPSEAPSSAGSVFFPPKPFQKTVRHHIEFEDSAHPSKDREMSGNREMTLRMTLTRPDLRADEAAIYDPSNKASDKPDPLALEHLPTTGAAVTAMPVDIWDSLPPVKDGGVLKRVWRKVSGKTV